jgi:ADP-ribosylglycohydrolase
MNNNIENLSHSIIGAIVGDVIGSVYEFHNVKKTDFTLFGVGSNFTDDTVMTVAVADWLVTEGDLQDIMRTYGRKYPRAGYGASFFQWLTTRYPQPYNSWGNGAAMRVSPVGWAFDTLQETLAVARKSAEVTHNHPEGVKGAQATATAIFLSRTGKSKQEIKAYIKHEFGYHLDRTCDEIRPTYHFDISCQGSVPEAIIAFLESEDYEQAIRLAVSLGGDSDTIACIAGGIAAAFYKEIPSYILTETCNRLPGEFVEVLRLFDEKIIKK